MLQNMRSKYTNVFLERTDIEASEAPLKIIWVSGYKDKMFTHITIQKIRTSWKDTDVSRILIGLNSQLPEDGYKIF